MEKNHISLSQYVLLHSTHTIYEELCFLLHMPIQSILRSCKSCKLRSIFLRKTIFICNCQKTFFNNIHTLVFFQILFFLSLSRLINSKFARFYKRCIHAMNWLTGACSHSDIFTYIYIARQRDMSMKRSGMQMHRVDKLGFSHYLLQCK